MAPFLMGHGSGATVVLLTAFVVFLVTIPSNSGARCRFASSSASQDSCIFPCRCTKGCNTTTGDCLDDGRCVAGHPSDHRWSGPACQIG
ncbi:hypothetical protein NP493_2592g00012 [Ridgeia piscesae]|uniref:Secreted peptide n=1 Tax=Ridgeia piscesae TaxID=27915 RepID=A0AAD9N2C2_RIDPI|nr:hypothetical protein NP493_2592g00012 [Ridgeia piscesae]